jgi:cell division protein FtsB
MWVLLVGLAIGVFGGVAGYAIRTEAIVELHAENRRLRGENRALRRRIRNLHLAAHTLPPAPARSLRELTRDLRRHDREQGVRHV